ncbi:MAG: hydrogen gas-evolving membrane-bound hydrogenase subunit E [Pseudomonadota bacterium]
MTQTLDTSSPGAGGVSHATHGWFDAAYLVALVPLAVLGAILSLGPTVLGADSAAEWSMPWVPSLGIALSFRIDGFSFLFGTLIAGIGSLVAIYAAAYMKGDAHRGRFLLLIVLFMGAMLGAIFAADVILLFVFWELTSLLSFLLIGHKASDPAARRAAVQGLMVTVGGGLALMAGLLLMASIAGTTSLPGIIAAGPAIIASPLFVPALLLMLLGAFTKSAQVPFHFWLPGAMSAPTPASAFLHSATMVKLGVYLLIRFDPAFGDEAIWQTLLIGFGGATMLVAAVQALRVEAFKAVLAQTTIAALGTLTLLVGLTGPVAAVATVGFLLSHALYKAALFFAAGNAIHATGVDRLSQMGGLARSLPFTAGAAVIACLSMAGLPPFIGFIAKELLFEAKLDTGTTALIVLAVIVNAVLVAVAAVVALRPFFFGEQRPAQLKHGETVGLAAPPILLACIGAMLGLLPGLASNAFLTDAVSAAAGETIIVDLKLWHGLTPYLGLSVLAVTFGALIAWRWRSLNAALASRRMPTAIHAERLSDRAAAGVLNGGRALTARLQNGSLRKYAWVPLLAFALVIALALVSGGMALPPFDLTERPYLILIVAVLVAGSFVAATARSFLAVLIAIGLVGYALGVLFLKKGAPDLAFTQFAVETVFVVVAAAVLVRMPLQVLEPRVQGERRADAALALSIGVLGTLVALAMMGEPFDPRISDYFREVSLPEAFGRNVVNVVIVDFRALDTLGEIAVVALAALAAFGVMRGLRARRTIEPAAAQKPTAEEAGQ